MASQAIAPAATAPPQAQGGTLDDAWKKKKKHIFIFTSSGKPIYSRYGDESKLAGLIGVLVGLISFVERTEDEIVWVRAGSHKIVFYTRAPIFCAMIAKTTEAESQLKQQLQYMHSQIISILTETANKVLRDNPRFDLRNLLSGTDRFMNRLAIEMDVGPQYLLNAIQCLRVPATLRASIGQILSTEHKGDNLFYALLVARGYLVSLVRPKKHILYPPDLHLLINFISSSNTFRDSEATLTPICLPLFNNRGFLQLYTSFLTTDVCLLLLTSQSDAVSEMRETKELILRAMQAPPQLLSQLQTILATPVMAGSHFYPVSEIGITDLLHFVYRSHTTSQMTAPHPTAPYHTKKQLRRLFRAYQRIAYSVHVLDDTKPHKVYYERSPSENFIAWVTKEFDLYACFSPLVSKPDAIKSCNQLLKWIKVEEPNLFILNSPIW